jgi:hypothetical protein
MSHLKTLIIWYRILFRHLLFFHCCTDVPGGCLSTRYAPRQDTEEGREIMQTVFCMKWGLDTCLTLLETNSVAVRICALTEDHSDARISVVSDLATSCRLSCFHNSYDMLTTNFKVCTFLKMKTVRSSRFFETFQIFDHFCETWYEAYDNGSHVVVIVNCKLCKILKWRQQ